MSRTDLSEDGAVLLSTLTAPERGLAAAVARRRPAVALLVATLASLLFAAVAAPRLDFTPPPPAPAPAPQGGQGEPPQELTPHQQEEAATQARKLGIIGTWAGAATGPVVQVLLGALALFLAFRLAGTRPDLKATVAVSAHAFLPLFLSPLLALPALVQKAPLPALELPRLLPSSLAAFLPLQASPLAQALASSVDLFTLWAVALLVLGMARVAGSSRRRAAAVVSLLWLAQIAVLKVALPALLARRPGGA